MLEVQFNSLASGNSVRKSKYLSSEGATVQQFTFNMEKSTHAKAQILFPRKRNLQIFSKLGQE